MFNLFSNAKNIIKSPQVLICSVGDTLVAENLQQGKSIYQVYQNTTTYQADNGADVLAFIDGKTYDIVHIFTALTAHETADGLPGIQLLAGLSTAGAKLIVFARENSVENYARHSRQSSVLVLSSLIWC